MSSTETKLSDKPMKKKAKQKLGPWQKAWLQTLESGMFGQTKEVLATKKDGEYSFCCLGIACEVAIENGVAIRVCEDYGYSVGYDRCYSALPNSVKELMAFRVDNGSEKNAVFSLAELNDRQNKSFAQIAAIVRKDPSVYFRRPA